MAYSRRSRESYSPSPYKRYGRSLSRSLSRSHSFSRSRSRSRESSVENPGNNLYVTGLSACVTKRELEKHFASEGKVEDVHLVTDPWTKESRGFGFVTMSCLEEADRCVKYLNRSVLEGRVITVEKAKRRRGRTPTPGRYLGLRAVRNRRRSPTYSPPTYSPYGRRASRYSSDRERSYSPYYRRGRDSSYSPYYRRDRSYSPYYRRSSCWFRSKSRSAYNSMSPVSRRSQYDYSPDDRYYRRNRYRSYSRSYSPRGRSYPPSYSPRPRRSRRSYSHSYSPKPRRSSRRSYSPRPRRSSRRSYSRRSTLYSRKPYDSYSSRSCSSGSAPFRSRSVSRSARSRSASLTD